MQSAMQFAGYVPDEITTHLPKMRGWLKDLPDKTIGGKPYTIHALVRAAKELFVLPRWECVDGHFARRTYEHAWLACKDGNSTFVIDLMPWGGMGGPIAIPVMRAGLQNATPWDQLYMPDGARFSARLAEFLRDADAIVAESKSG